MNIWWKHDVCYCCGEKEAAYPAKGDDEGGYSRGFFAQKLHQYGNRIAELKARVDELGTLVGKEREKTHYEKGHNITAAELNERIEELEHGAETQSSELVKQVGRYSAKVDNIEARVGELVQWKIDEPLGGYMPNHVHSAMRENTLKREDAIKKRIEKLEAEHEKHKRTLLLVSGKGLNSRVEKAERRLDNLEPYARDILSGQTCRNDSQDQSIEKLENWQRNHADFHSTMWQRICKLEGDNTTPERDAAAYLQTRGRQHHPRA
jgi:superoxide dismutase